MRMSSLLRAPIPRRFVLLAASTFVLVAALAGAPPKAQACVTCLQETSQAYVFCQHHPKFTEYVGCNFDVTCGLETQSPQEIYNLECVG
jgi:hypothetical protein